jgi:8-oxo-dGTP pyrophosphatase MutT (NUDIX family)
MDHPSDLSLAQRQVLQCLGTFVPEDRFDTQVLREMRDFVSARPDCLTRDCQPGHLTASALLLSSDSTRALFTHHRKLGRWLQLGGHVDGDPDLLGAAVREAQEESGIAEIEVVTTSVFDLDIHMIPETSKEPAHLHYDVRFVLRAAHDLFVVSDESLALAWLPLDDLALDDVDESVLRLVDRWRALQSLHAESVAPTS